ncbi:hypothetical protein [Asanoa iriomotensis]|uniref:Uncharacterized protein n=1 Tax=Asanoa iriomotensis TaxID=234613 RepID=A0ABQ4BXE2_9ACTN|nr:hypothetical protein [Asanoa iriomotensis]GIF55155.1 hypothetical protein Air01nite_12500 [Asanoa iriomotensis]
MTTWRGVRKELVGAWRSVQYDLTRARNRKNADGEETTELIFPEHAAPPRRLVATGGFALVSLVGAVGTYFVVVNGLGALLNQPEATEQPVSVVAGADGTGQRPEEVSLREPVRIAREGGPLTVAGRQAASGGAGSSDTHDGAPTDVGPAPDPERDPGDPGDPQPEESDPPPTEDPTPTPSPTPAEPTPTAEPSPSPTASASESSDAQPYEGRPRRHHHRHPDENP